MKIQKYKIAGSLGRFFLCIFLFFFMLIMVLPFWYNLVFASRDITTGMRNPPPFWFGNKFISNMEKISKQLPFLGLNIFNTILIAVLAAGTQVFFCTMAGFAFAVYDFKGKQLLYKFMLITLCLPPLINIIPFFRMMLFFDWVNTALPLFIPGMANAFGIFLMTQYIAGAVPHELIDSARSEGWGEFQILLNICFPLARPALVILGTIVFITTWNEFVLARVILVENSRFTLGVALSYLNFSLKDNYSALILGNILNLLPPVILFLLFAKQIVYWMIKSSSAGMESRRIESRRIESRR